MRYLCYMEQTERTSTMQTTTDTFCDWNLSAADFETDDACGRCGDETEHVVFVTGKGYGYIVCTVCETERDWNAEEFYGDF